jgi:hypothetical protein
MVKLQAKDFLHPRGLVVESATLLANALVEQLHQGHDVEISLSCMMGLPGSYFNVVLLALADAIGVDEIERRVRFEFEFQAQRLIYDRSLGAVRASVA